MLQLLETGKALYALAAICLLGIMTRGITRHLYKRLLKESTNLTLTKNKCLKELRQRAENTYRVNQGLRDSGSWLEHQLYDLKVLGMTLAGWSTLSMQWTWLCLLAGGAGAFLSYWYRLDTYYIVMYGGGAVLLSMFTMLFDNGMAGGWREQLVVALQDQLENVMCPRLARSMTAEGGRSEGAAERSGIRGGGRLSDRAGRLIRGGQDPEEQERQPAMERVGAMSGAMPSDRGGAMTGAMPSERGGAMNGAMPSERGGAMNGAMPSERGGAMNGAMPSERGGAMNGAVAPERGGAAAATAAAAAGTGPNGGGNAGTGGRKGQRGGRRNQAADTSAGAGTGGQENIRDVDYLKRSLEQIAASREKSRMLDENWLRDLKPEEVELIGDILKQYLA